MRLAHQRFALAFVAILLVLSTILTPLAQAQVGIGTTTPDASAQLELQTTTRGFLPPRMTALEMNAIASPANGLVVFNTTAGQLYFYDAGAVLWKAVAGVAGGGGWDLGGNAITNPSTEWLGTTTAQPIIFRTNSTQRMVLTDVGNLGIGTAGPSTRLHVQSYDGNNTGYTTLSTFSHLTSGSAVAGMGARLGFELQNDIANPFYGGYIGLELADATNGAEVSDLTFVTRNAGTNAEAMRLTGGGYLGIGTTTPAAKLEVTNSIQPTILVSTPNGGEYAQFRATAGAVDAVYIADELSGAAQLGTFSTHPLLFRTDFTERMRIDVMGNVGIGIAAPQYPLHTVGESGITNGEWQAGHFFAVATPSGVSAAQIAALNGVALVGDISGDVTNATQIGVVGRSENTSGVDLGTGIGIIGQVHIDGSNLGYAAGLRSEISTNAGAITGAYGVDALFTNNSADIITHSIGFRPQIVNQAGGEITNAYGMYVPDAQNTLGTITNFTGVGVANLTAGTNNRAFYYGHGSRPFVVQGDGNVGIGTASPGHVLHVENGTSSYIARFTNSGEGAGVIVQRSVSAGANNPALRVENNNGDANDLISGDATNLGNLLNLSLNGTAAFTVGNDGNLALLRGVGYTWPSAQGAASTVLTNDGSGNLTWAAGGGGDNWGAQTANTSGVITGDGSGSAIRLTDGTAPNQVPVWDGSAWSIAASPGDNLGNHTATTNLNMGANLITGGGATGIGIDANGNVGVGIAPSALHRLSVQQPASVSNAAAIFGNASGSDKVFGVWGLTSVSTTDSSAGIRGEANGGGGTQFGVWGSSNSTFANSAGVYGTSLNGYGVLGISPHTGIATSGVRGEHTGGGTNIAYGVYGSTNTSNPTAGGVYGTSSGLTPGVFGESTTNLDNGVGVRGRVTSASAKVYGVRGSVLSSTADSTAGVRGDVATGIGMRFGVMGTTSSTGNNAAGIFGQSYNTGASVSYGVWGTTAATINQAAGVFGSSNTIANGVFGLNTSANANATGVLGRSSGNAKVYGVLGEVTTSTTDSASGIRGNAFGVGIGMRFGVMGTLTGTGANSAAVYGAAQSATANVTYGVRGLTASSNANAAAIYGTTTTAGNAVYGINASNIANGAAIKGEHNLAGVVNTYGVWGSTNSSGATSAGVMGNTTNAPFGVRGFNNGTLANGAAVRGEHASGTANLVYGVWGSTTSTNANSAGVYGVNAGAGWAGDFAGNLRATGNVNFTGLSTVGTIATEQFAVVDPATGLVSRYTGGLPGDNLGNHTATTNIQLGANWLSGDGGNEGLKVDATGNVGVGPATTDHRFVVDALPGTDPFMVRSGGSGYLRMVSGGRVGIGSFFTPLNALDVDGGMVLGNTYKGTQTAPASGLLVEGNVGIGNSAASHALTVGSTEGFQVSSTGDVRMINAVTYAWPGSQGAAGTVLTNDGTGVLTWAPASGSGDNWGAQTAITSGVITGNGSGSAIRLADGTATNQVPVWDGSAWSITTAPGGGGGWQLTGNGGTNPATNFVGTTDVQPLRFRVNNAWAGSIETGGLTSFGFGAAAVSTSPITAVGFNALNINSSGFNNTAIGYQALSSNTTGNTNTAVGNNALFANSTGSQVTAVGSGALQNNTIGANNVAVGTSALFGNIDGANLTAVGVGALQNNGNASSNSAFGNAALFANTTGANNTAVGKNALTNNNGSRNTAVGLDALIVNTTGNDNTAIGYSATNSVNNLTNATAIGAYARVDASNSVVIGSVAGVNGAIATASVGIGINAPNHRLHVVSNVSVIGTAAVFGVASAPNRVYGVRGQTTLATTDSASGVRGDAFTGVGMRFGVMGTHTGTGANSAGVYGAAQGNTANATYGVWGNTISANINGAGVRGRTSSAGSGVLGENEGILATSAAVRGVHLGATGNTTYGVYGSTVSTGADAAAVYGVNAGAGWAGDFAGKLRATGNVNLTGLGTVAAITTEQFAVVDPATGLVSRFTGTLGGADNLGNHTATTNLNIGANLITGGGASGIGVDANGNVGVGITPTHQLDVFSNSVVVDRAAIMGTASGNNRVFGVRGQTTTSITDSASGVRGDAFNTGLGIRFGVMGTHTGTGANSAGVYGASQTSTANITYGVRGTTASTSLNAAAVFGSSSTAASGVRGVNTSLAINSVAVYGAHLGGTANLTYGVYGSSLSTNASAAGVYGTGINGVHGLSASGIANGAGVRGEHTNGGSVLAYGVWGSTSSANSNVNSAAIYGENAGAGWAGDFAGKLRATGNVTLSGLSTVGTIGTEQFAVVDPATGLVSRYTGSIPGDNLGNHTATQNLDLSTFQLTGNGGTQGIAISAVGNVGIGTTTPSAKLHVSQTLAQLAMSIQQTGNAHALTINNTNTNNVNALRLESSSFTGHVQTVIGNSPNTNGIGVIVNQGVGLEMNNTGGQNISAVNTTGRVATFTRTGVASSFNPVISILSQDGNDGEIGLYVEHSGSGQAMNVQNVGTGNAAEIGITGTRTVNSTAATIFNSSNSTNPGLIATGLSITSTGSQTGVGSRTVGLSVTANGAPENYAAVFENGNVGIGTNAPAATLHNIGSVRFASLPDTVSLGNNHFLSINPATGELKRVTGSIGGGDNLGNHTAITNLDLSTFQLVGNGGSTGIAVANNGFVGIGTLTPFSHFDVYANSPAASNEAVVRFGVQDAPNDHLTLWNGIGTDGLFQPLIESRTEGHAFAGLTLKATTLLANDAGGNPMMIFETMRDNAGLDEPITTRPLFRWANQGNIIAQVDANGNHSIYNAELLLRDALDLNHGIGWYGIGKPFNGVAVNGPVVYGYNGGALGWRDAGSSLEGTVLHWTTTNVGIGTATPLRALQVEGEMLASGVANRFSLARADGSDPLTTTTWHLDNTFNVTNTELRFYNQPDLNSAGTTRLAIRDNGDVIVPVGGRLGVNTLTPAYHLHLDLPSTEFGGAVYGGFFNRQGTNVAAEGGTGWNTPDAAIAARNVWGNNFSTGIYSQVWTDYENSAGILAFNNSNSNYAALVYRDALGTNYAGYFSGALYASSSITAAGLPLQGTFTDITDDLLMVDAAGNVQRYTGAIPGDNLGNHLMTSNLITDNHWITGDNDPEGLWVNFSGDVGVGTSTPTARFTVNGDISFPHSANRTIRVDNQPDNALNGFALTLQGGSAVAGGQARTGGNVVIAGGQAYNVSIGGADGGDVILRSGGNLIDGVDDGGDIIFELGGANNSITEGMRLMEGGNLGIGTNAPVDRLHIVGNQRTLGSGQFLLDNAGNYGIYIQNRNIATGVPGGRVGISMDVSSTGGETKYGVAAVTGGTNGTRFSVHANATGSGGQKYGVAGFANGAGDNYAIYGTASGGTNNWAGFFQDGNVYIQNQLGIGTGAPDQLLTVNGNASKPGGGGFLAFSDERLKTNIQDFAPGIAELLQLRTVSYQYRADNALGINGEGTYYGFVAQEVQRVLPFAVTESTNGYLQLNLDPIVWTTVNAVQQQQGMIDELRQQVQGLSTTGVGYASIQQVNALDTRMVALETENAQLRSRLAQQESRIAALENAFARR